MGDGFFLDGHISVVIIIVRRCLGELEDFPGGDRGAFSVLAGKHGPMAFV